MAYLAAAAIFVGVLCLVDLLLTVGVIRRLREHTHQLNRVLQAETPPEAVPAGERVADFAATTTDGEPVSRDLIAGPTVVGFFAPGCQPCAAELPHFLALARSELPAKGQLLAVVDADSGDSAGYVDRLAPVARVVVEGHDGALHTAFQVAAFPTFFLIDRDGLVRANGATTGAVR